MAEKGVQEVKFNLIPNAQRYLSKFIAKQGEKPKTTVRFFDHEHFYTVHGKDDCKLLAQMIYKSESYVHNMLEDEPNLQQQYVALSKFNFENALRDLLLVQNYRVEVFVRASVNDDWKLEYRGSPGNLLQFEDILFANKDVLAGNTVISIQMRKEASGNAILRKLGLAAIEQNDCRLQLCEFIDNDFLTELEACLVLLSPKECVLPSLEGEYESVRALLERNGIMATLVKRSSNESADVYQQLNRLLRFKQAQQQDSQTLPELNLQLGRDALQLGIKYLDLTNDAANLGQYVLQQLNLERFVHLDAAAVAALNLLPKPGLQASAPSYRWSSILGVLDHCRTPQGHRLMAQWVKQPLRNRDLINDRQHIVQCLLEDSSTLENLHKEQLKRMPDLLMLTNKLMRKKATLQDLFRIHMAIMRMPKIIEALQLLQDATVKSMLCAPMQQQIEDLAGLRKMVAMTLDFESIDKGEYLVKASFDQHLDELKERMDKLLAKMRRLQEKAAEDLGFDQVERVRLENVSHLGYHFRIVLKDDGSLRKNKYYKVLDAVRGGVRFTCDKLTELSESFKTVREDYEEQQRVIVDEIIKVAIGYATPLALLNHEIAQLDCFVSFAVAARDAPTPYVRPEIVEEGAGELLLRDLRHPCLELQEHVSYIANNVEFHKDECNMYIITGPNMGGKSTYIRSTGVAVLMALIGAFVPCSKATISIVDSILGRIGASDNQFKGVSTFMMEMIETSGILRTATDKSLVVIDELGRGTSTFDGCGIAWAIAEHLAKEVRCFTLFATHFHEITTLAETVKTVRNYHMAAAADDKNFTLLYEVRPGVSLRSFGIQVAHLAQFPADVVEFAERVYNEYEDPFLEKQMQEDKKLLQRIESAADELLVKADEGFMNIEDFKTFAAKFVPEIQTLQTDYITAVKSNVEKMDA